MVVRLAPLKPSKQLSFVGPINTFRTNSPTPFCRRTRGWPEETYMYGNLPLCVKLGLGEMGESVLHAINLV